MEQKLTIKPLQIQKTKLITACIVMPTYNEANNIIPILDKIFDEEYANKSKRITINVLVVDDNSPDGTANKVIRYKRINSNGQKVHLLTRKKKEGLGAAYIHGMKHAMETINPDYILEMDADGQHDPEDLYNLFEAMGEGYDFVIGSRYVNGGSVPKSWGWNRKLVSWCAGTVIKVGLGLNGIKDCSGGFRVMRSDMLKQIDLDKLNVKGYAFQAALLEAVVYGGFEVKEVPISFGQRTEGESKMGFSDMAEGWKLIYHVRKQRLKRLLGVA